jgi:hypothetical protein
MLHQPSPGRNRSTALPARRGVAYIEVIVAFVVFALTIAGLGATIVSQEKLMRGIERRDYVLVLVPSNQQMELNPGADGSWFIKAPHPRTGLPPIEASAVDHMADDALGAAPSLLTVIEGPGDHWPGAEVSTEPPRIHSVRMGPREDEAGSRILQIVGTDAADPSILTVDVLP